MLRKEERVAVVYHGKATFLTIGLLLYSHQEGRQSSTYTPYQEWSSQWQGLLTRVALSQG